jgi:hypothetical protein
MSCNRYQPHVLVLPEDDANRQLANGFLMDGSLLIRNIQVLPEIGGWIEVLDHFKSDQVKYMDRYRNGFMVLLIDFDGKAERLRDAKKRIPERLAERVFILGALTEPEALKDDLGSYETIGLAMARDCREGTETTWGHDLLRHNAGELERLRENVRQILFP